MLASTKPLASLSSGLLARQGQARPAMRRQMTLAQAGDQLGWNDMGEPLPVADAPLPPVLAQREELAESIEAATLTPAPDRAAALEAAPSKRRTAFTLRLDAERRLRLRLASATCGVSAQKLVTEALDAFLESMPGFEALAAGAPGAKSRSVRGTRP